MGLNLGTISAAVRLDLSKLNSDSEIVKGTMKKLQRDMTQQMGELRQKVGDALTGAGLAAGAGLGVATKAAAEFDQSMRNVNSLAKESESDFQALKNSVKALADDPRIRQGPKNLAAGLYDVVGSGFSGKQALDVLKVSAIGASAGLTTTATASKVLTAVLNSGISGVHSAREAMDVLFREVDLGVNTFEELANSLGDVLPMAKTMGVSLQEVTAALALMTRQGINVSESGTAVVQLLNHIAKPGKEAAKLMDELGIHYGTTATQSKGLVGWLQEVIQKTHGNKDALTKLVPEVRGMKALLSLTTDGVKSYHDLLQQTMTASDGLGASQRALTEQNKGAVAQWELLKKQLELVSVDVGEVLLPTLNKLTGALRGVLGEFRSLPKETQEGIVKFTALSAILMTVAGVTLRVVQAVSALRLALLALGVSGGPVAVIVALGAAIFGVAYALDRLLNVQPKATAEMLEEAKQAKAAADNQLQHATEIKKLVDRYEQLRQVAAPTKQQLAEMQSVLDQISQLSPSLVTGYDKQGHAIGLMGDAVQSTTDKLKEMAHQARIASAAVVATQRQGLAQRRSDLHDELEQEQALLKSGQEPHRYVRRSGFLGIPYMERIGEHSSTAAETSARAAHIRDLQSQIAEVTRQLPDLDKQMHDIFHPKTPAGSGGGGKGGNHGFISGGGGKSGKSKAKDDADEIKDAYIRMLDQIAEARASARQKEALELGQQLRENLKTPQLAALAWKVYGEQLGYLKLKWLGEDLKASDERQAQEKEAAEASWSAWAKVYGAQITGSLESAVKQAQALRTVQEAVAKLTGSFSIDWQGGVSRAFEGLKRTEEEILELRYRVGEASLQEYRASLVKRMQALRSYNQEEYLQQLKLKEQIKGLDDEMVRQMDEKLKKAGKGKSGLADAISGQASAVKNAMNGLLHGITETIGQNLFKGLKGTFGQLLTNTLTSLLSDVLENALTSAFKKKKKGAGGLGGLFNEGGSAGGILGGILGGVSTLFNFGFDDGYNDGVARRWGFDFAHNFSKGMAQHGNQRLAPVGRQTSGGPTVHVHMNGDNHFNSEMDINHVADTLAWRLQARLRMVPGNG